MNIIDAVTDRRLMMPFLQGNAPNLRTWRNWLVVLRLLYGLPVKEKHSKIVLQLTGRPLDSFKADGKGFSEGLFLVSRRSGKTRITATVGIWEACFSGNWEKLSPGEMGIVVCISASKKQCRVMKNYMRAIFEQTPILENEVVKETSEGFVLSNGVTIEIMVADFRVVRGYSLLAACCDEICFMHLDADAKIRNDSELIQALRPALSTLSGRLICLSSKYAKRGFAYRCWKKNWGNPDSKILVVDSDSRTLNPTLSQEVVDAAYAEDAASARSEYGGLWREDISAWLPVETIQSVVVKGRKELIKRQGTDYTFFADVSGGRKEDSCLGIGHKHKNTNKAILDALYIYRAPNNPAECIDDMCQQIRKFSGCNVFGDAYAAEFVSAAFKKKGIGYEKSPLSKSALYLELIGHICSDMVELLDNETLIKQLCGLERKTRSGGKDSVDHPQGQKDDAANSAAGVLVMMNYKNKRAGVFL